MKQKLSKEEKCELCSANPEEHNLDYCDCKCHFLPIVKRISTPQEEVLSKDEIRKRLGDKSHIDYERNESHYHCWNQVDNEDNDIEPLETPACGQKLEDHKQCCLCDTPYPQEEKKEYIKKLECGCWETTNESGVGAGSYCINHAPIREDFGENPLHISAEALLECNFRTKELLKKARQEGYEEGRKYTLDDLLKQAEKAKQIARADLIKELREVRDSDSCECDNCHRVRKFIKKYENQ